MKDRGDLIFDFLIWKFDLDIPQICSIYWYVLEQAQKQIVSCSAAWLDFILM